MSSADDLSFEIEGSNGPIRVIVSSSVLRSFAGRSHVTVTEVLQIYRMELEEAALAKARKSGSGRTIRLEASDL